MSDSNVTFLGTCTRDPELRFVANGQAVIKFGIAVNRRWMANGEWKEETSFFDVNAWGKLAENVASSVAKGTRVVVTGRLEQRSWEKDGQKHYAIQCVADDIGVSLKFATASVERNAREGNVSQSSSSQSSGSSLGYNPDDAPF